MKCSERLQFKKGSAERGRELKRQGQQQRNAKRGRERIAAEIERSTSPHKTVMGMGGGGGDCLGKGVDCVGCCAGGTRVGEF